VRNVVSTARVSAVSRKLFESDPFLVRKSSLDSYGLELEDNIMTRRTVFSAKHDFLRIIESPKARPAPKRPKKKPDDGLKDRYQKSRRERIALDKTDRRALQAYTMVTRGELTERRVRDVKDDKGNITGVKFQRHDEAQKDLKQLFDNRLRIAAIGFRVKISAIPAKSYLDEDLWPMRPPKPRKISPIPDNTGIGQLGRTVLATNAQKDKWIDTVCGHISKAIERGSQFVVLPEFALPPFMDKVELETRISDCCKAACAKSPHEHFVFAGSRHEGAYNRGLTLKMPREADAEQKWHYKIFSAHALRENILGPLNNRYPKYETNVNLNGEKTRFVVTIAICYDSFDPSNFLRLVIESFMRVKKNLDDEIILVPSFNTSDVFVEYLRDLSFLTGSTVVYVNALHGDTRIFVCGFSIGDLLDEGRGHAFANVREHIEELRADYHACIALRDAAIADNRMDDADRHFQDAGAVKTRRRELEGHLATLQGVKDHQAFEHLITVEHCEQCSTNGHDDDYGCYSDILYYNIDTRLLDAITWFRQNYILSSELFLPRPFQTSSIKKLLDDLEESVTD